MKSLIDRINKDLLNCVNCKDNLDEASWGHEQGVLLTPNQAKQISEYYENSLAALEEAKRCLLERMRISYTQAGSDDATAESMAQIDIKRFMLYPIIEEGSSELNDWYGRQPFDNVEKITGVDIWTAYEADEIEEGDTEKVSRDEALDEARKVWDKMSISEKQEWRNSIGDNA